MSSPPSSATSTKAATISSRKDRRSNSFPSLAALIPFRSRSVPEPLTPPEPFLVAPNIWSTDATAKVFGYVETDDRGRPRLARSNSAGAENRDKKPKPSIKGSFQGGSLLNRYEDVQADAKTYDSSIPTYVGKCDAWTSTRQQALVEAKSEEKNSARHSHRGRMRTVSHDDELIERGANPRTGVISPYVTSDGSADGADYGYIAEGYAKNLMSSASRRTSSGRWQQTGASWSFVEDQVPSPTRLQPNDKPSRQLSVKKVQDTLLAQISGVDKPKLDNMSIDQIKRYHESVERAHKLAGGDHAMVDPETLPTPRQASPGFGTEGPSTPPNRLHKIRRKKVGSATTPAEKSDDTIVVNGKQRSLRTRPPPIRIPSMDKQHVRIISPSMAALGVPARTPLDVEASFLGSPQQCYRTASAGQFLSAHPLSPQTNQQERCQQTQFPDHTGSPPEVCSAPRVSSPTLSQFLPRLQLPHPNQFANLESPSYRHPARLLPPSLRSGPQKRQLVEDAATITTTITSGQKRHRPGMQRSEGRHTVPRASHPNLEDHPRYESSVPSQILLIKVFEPSSPTRSTGDGEDAKSNRHQRDQLCPSHLIPTKEQRAVPGAVHRNSDRCHSNPSQKHPEAPLVSIRGNDRCHTCQESTHQTAPTAKGHNSNSCPLGLSTVHSNVPIVTTSEPADRMKEVKVISNLTTEPIHRALLHPCQQSPDGTEGVVLQASCQRGSSQDSRNHQRVTSVASKGPETTKPTANPVERKLNGNQQFRQYPKQVSSGSNGVVHAARVAMLGEDQHQHQREKVVQAGKKAGHRKTQNQTANVKDVYGIASDQIRQNRDASGLGIIRALDLQDHSTLAPRNGTDTITSARAKEEPQRDNPAPESKGDICLTGHRAEDTSDDMDNQSITTLSTNADELLSRQRSLPRRENEFGPLLAAVEHFTQPKVYLSYVGDTLWHMTVHVMSTLHYGSPAISVLRSSDSTKVGSRELLYATKEVALAIAYLLVLLNVAMLLRKIVMTVLQFVYWIWHPLTALSAIIRWCLIT